MSFYYHQLPFGAQILLWTSRIMINGSCRCWPNKYQIVETAYKKVGVNNGVDLLKDFLQFLKKKDYFIIQNISAQNLLESEINLITCIEQNINVNFNNSYYIQIWNLENTIESFALSAHNLALAFQKSNLNIDISSSLYKNNIENYSNQESLLSKTLH